MIKIEKTDLHGFDVAIRAMRNSFDSWEKSDSEWKNGEYVLGKDDLALMQKLIRNGDDHAKFMRFVTVTCDITAPRYWWTEFDTYKVGTVRCSCSTMHTITKREITLDMFSLDGCITGARSVMSIVIETLNNLRYRVLNPTDTDKKTGEVKRHWRSIIQLLPQSYNQKSTVMLNYQVLRHMYHARKAHKLTEWHEFCTWIESLPYSELITE